MGRVIFKLLLLFSMMACTYFFYFNAQEQARLYKDYLTIYYKVAESDTLRTTPVAGTFRYKVIEHEGDMNANAGLSVSIFVSSIIVTVIFSIYILISEIILAIRNYRLRQGQNKLL